MATDDDDDDEDDLVVCANPGCGAEFELSEKYTGDPKKALCPKCLRVRKEAKVAKKDDAEKPAAAAKAVGVGAAAAGVAAAVGAKKSSAVKDGAEVLGTLAVRQLTRALADNAPDAWIRWTSAKTRGGSLLEEGAAAIAFALDRTNVLPEGVQSLVNDFVIDFAAAIKDRIARGGLTPEVKLTAQTAIDAIDGKLRSLHFVAQGTVCHHPACITLPRERPGKQDRKTGIWLVEPVEHRKLSLDEVEGQMTTWHGTDADGNVDPMDCGCYKLVEKRIKEIRELETSKARLKAALEGKAMDGDKKQQKLSLSALLQQAQENAEAGKPEDLDSFGRMMQRVQGITDDDARKRAHDMLTAYVHDMREVRLLGQEGELLDETLLELLEGCRDPDEVRVSQDFAKAKEWLGETAAKVNKATGVPAALGAATRGLRGLTARLRTKHGGGGTP